MTPKEKANELYFKFIKALDIRSDMRPEANPYAKQCALIAVEEAVLYHPIHSKPSVGDIEFHSYWNQVKEIIKSM